MKSSNEGKQGSRTADGAVLTPSDSGLSRNVRLMEVLLHHGRGLTHLVVSKVPIP